MKNKNLQVKKKRLMKNKKCPFCGGAAQIITMKGTLGFCIYIVCNSDKCKIHPSTPLFESKTEEGGLKKALAVWNKRKR